MQNTKGVWKLGLEFTDTKSACVSVYLKKAKLNTLATLAMQGRERHGSVVTQQSTQHLTQPPLDSFIFLLSP